MNRAVEVQGRSGCEASSSARPQNANRGCSQRRLRETPPTAPSGGSAGSEGFLFRSYSV